MYILARSSLARSLARSRGRERGAHAQFRRNKRELSHVRERNIKKRAEHKAMGRRGRGDHSGEETPGLREGAKSEGGGSETPLA